MDIMDVMHRNTPIGRHSARIVATALVVALCGLAGLGITAHILVAHEGDSTSADVCAVCLTLAAAENSPGVVAIAAPVERATSYFPVSDETPGSRETASPDAPRAPPASLA